MEVIYSKAFRKALAKLVPRDFMAVENAVTLFQGDRWHPALRDHALKGKMKNLRAFSAGFDLRIIYRDEGGFITITLLDVGTHNQVY
jgi:addiction module RelE/StbE family toxin